MHNLLTLLIALASWMPSTQHNIADVFQHLQDKYPPSQSETWIIHRVTESENRLIRDGMNIPGFRADNYVIFETQSKRIIRDIRNQVKKLKEEPTYTRIYQNTEIPGIEITIYGHQQGDHWVQAYAVLLQKEVAYFAYVDGSIANRIFERHQQSIFKLLDEYAHYLSNKIDGQTQVNFFKLLPRDNQ